MLIVGVEASAEILLRWVLLDDEKRVLVDYFDLYNDVKCQTCGMRGCTHVKYVQSILSLIPATQIDIFIREFTGKGRSPEFIGEMQRAFDRAVGEKVASVEVTVKPKTPKPTPSPFSLIELD